MADTGSNNNSAAISMGSKYTNFTSESVLNSDDQIVPAYRFLLRVEGFQDVPLRSIRPFSKENEYEYIAEGGLNDYVHTVRKPASKPFTLVVERYISQKFIDPLTNGMQMVLPVILFIGNADAQKFDFKPVRTYIFTGCVVMNKEVGGFDAEKSGLLTETVTIGYENSFALNNITDIMSERWNFDNLKKEGKGKRYAAKDNLSMRKTEEDGRTEAEKNRWDFDGKKKEGKGKRHANTYEGAITVEGTMMNQSQEEGHTRAKANRWDFDGTKKDGKGTHHANTFDEAVTLTGTKMNQSQEEGHTLAKKNRWDFDGTNKDGKGTHHANTFDEAMFTPGSRVNQSQDEGHELAKANRWDFEGTKKDGKGKHHANTYDDAITVEGSMMNQSQEEGHTRAKANRWDFDGTKKDGTGKHHANTYDDAITVEGSMMNQSQEEGHTRAKANRWDFDGTNPAGKGKRSAAQDTLSTLAPQRVNK